MSDMTLTVLDTATIYEGKESIFRYDLPGTGVVEGWALAGVVEQAAKLVGPAWPDCDVAVVADASASDIGREAVEIIIRHIRLEGARVAAPSDPAPATDSYAAAASSVPRRAELSAGSGDASAPCASLPRGLSRRGRQSRRERSWGVEPLHVGVFAIIVAVCMGAAWAIIRTEPESAQAGARLSTPVTSTSHSASPMTEFLTPTSGVPEPDSSVTVEVEGMRLQLPRDFGWEVDEGVVTLTGRDPNLRVLIAADPLYAVPPAAILDEVRAQVDRDDSLSQLTDIDGRVAYVEDPGDGSIVAWTTWIDKDHQLSVGCHSRQTPTVAHKAACRIATESLEKIP